jgi:hypothetical protein
MAGRRADSLITVLPNATKAAQLYRDEVRAGLGGDDPEAMARARTASFELLGGERVKLERGPERGSLYAVFKLERLALLGRLGRGSGGAQLSVPTQHRLSLAA